MNKVKGNGFACYNENAITLLEYMVRKQIQVDMIFTDPPYKMTARGNHGNTGGMLRKKSIMTGQVFANNDMAIESYLPLLYKVLKQGGHCYIMTNHVNLTHFLKVIDEWKDEDDKQGFKFIKSLIWDKGNKIMGLYYMSQFEYILFLRKGKGIPINNKGTSDILQIKNKKLKDADGTNYHDTEKPVELAEILIQNSSSENEIVLDPFMGIGGCGVAALKNNRRFIGCEIDKNYFDIAVQRIQEGSVASGIA